MRRNLSWIHTNTKKERTPRRGVLYTIGRLIGAEDLKVSNSRMRSLTILFAMQR